MGFFDQFYGAQQQPSMFNDPRLMQQSRAQQLMQLGGAFATDLGALSSPEGRQPQALAGLKQEQEQRQLLQYQQQQKQQQMQQLAPILSKLPGFGPQGGQTAMNLLLSGVPLKEIMEMGKSPDFDTTPRDGINPETGQAGQYILRKDGTQQWLGSRPRDPLHFADGQGRDQYSGAAVGPMIEPPSVGIQRGQLTVSQQNATETGRHNRATEAAAQQTAGRATPPAGYRYKTDGQLEFIPGGPADPLVAGRGSGKPTEDQAKNSQLYDRAKNQLPIALEHWDALGSAQGGLSGIPGVGNYLAGEDFQRASGALRDIAASYLYSVSGATATPQEIQGTVERVLPRVTDTAQTRADKKKRLEDMVESIKTRAGPAYNGQPDGAPQQSAPQGGQPSLQDLIDEARRRGLAR